MPDKVYLSKHDMTRKTEANRDRISGVIDEIHSFLNQDMHLATDLDKNMKESDLEMISS
jgi:hypothetical protein